MGAAVGGGEEEKERQEEGIAKLSTVTVSFLLSISLFSDPVLHCCAQVVPLPLSKWQPLSGYKLQTHSNITLKYFSVMG